MNLKTYRAYTMAEALAAVKRDLGDDAVILHTRNYRRGGFLGLGRKLVVEVTAAPAAAVAEHQRRRRDGAHTAKNPAPTSRAASRAYQQSARQAAESPASNSDEPAPVTDEDRKRTQRLAQAMKEQHERRQAAASADTASAPAASTSASPEPPAANTSPNTAPAPQRETTSATPPAVTMPVARRFVLSSAERAGMAAEQTRNTTPHRRSAAATSHAAPSEPPAESSEAHVTTSNGATATGHPPSHATSEATSQPPSAPKQHGAHATSTAPTRRTVELFADDAASLDTGATRNATPHDGRAADGSAAMQQELSAIRDLVGQVLQRQSTSRGEGPTPAMPRKLFDMYLKLIGQDLSEELADEIVNKVRDELSIEQLDDDETLRQSMVRHLAAHVPVANQAVSTESPDDRPLTIALIGPTGVGKTTTLAKLAASFKLRHERRVGLITSDTYRIAAVDQLRTYANIIGLPLQVVLTPAEMKQALHALSDCDVILIDTAGRGQNDASKLSDLQSMLSVARPHEVHLVLSSTASEKVLLREAEAFSEVGADKVVLTKLDEAVSFGMLVNVMHRVGKKLSFVTTGQEVPDHLELGRPERIAELVLDAEVSA